MRDSDESVTRRLRMRANLTILRLI